MRHHRLNCFEASETAPQRIQPSIPSWIPLDHDPAPAVAEEVVRVATVAPVPGSKLAEPARIHAQPAKYLIKHAIFAILAVDVPAKELQASLITHFAPPSTVAATRRHLALIEPSSLNVGGTCRAALRLPRRNVSDRYGVTDTLGDDSGQENAQLDHDFFSFQPRQFGVF